jgi:hypothetical protein
LMQQGTPESRLKAIERAPNGTGSKLDVTLAK